MTLSNKRRVFVEEYLRCWNATEAAKRAGYSPRTARSQGQRLLTFTEVREAIDSRMREMKVTPDRVPDHVIRLGARASRFVYLIREERGLVKIGKAVNVDRRLSSLSTAVPYELTLLFAIETDQANEVEKRLHGEYAAKRVKGEWFALEDKDIEEIRHKWVA